MLAHALNPFKEMERFFESYISQNWLRLFRMEWPWLKEIEEQVPRVDIIERENEICVRAELPGVVKTDLDVAVTGTTVTIKGQRKYDEREEKGDYYRYEISRGDFARTVTLPSEIVSEKAKATYQDSILELTLPKAESSKRRSIKIA